MRADPLSPVDLLRAIELFGPQARPYNFDDCFDCWGLVRRVFDHLDDGYEMDGELRAAGDPEEAGWVAFSAPDELVPGDLLVTHPHVSEEFHTVFYCGRVAGLDMVYDASPRADVPLVEWRQDQWRLVEARALFTRYARATETTDRLRNDGGAYLRLWDDRERYYHRGLHARLLAGAAADPRLAGHRAAEPEAALGFGGASGPEAASGGPAERDLVAVRRAAGLSALPFYCLRRLPRDAAGREVYDNLSTRHLDYYIPDGAPVLDDDYEALMEGGEVAKDRALTRVAHPDARGASDSAAECEALDRLPTPGTQRPPAPHLTKAPLWIAREGPVTVEWEYPAPRGLNARDADTGPPLGGVIGCRVEVWEETWDCWKHRLLRRDFEEPLTAFTVPDELLHDSARFAVVVWARGPGGFSGTALAPFLYRPANDDPLLAYDPVRPEQLVPDEGAVVPAGAPVDLTWTIRRPLVSQSWFRLEVFEDACLTDGATPVFDAEAQGPAARVCKGTVPREVLRAGHTYAWYVTVRSADRRAAFAPAEGVFRVAREG